MTPEDRLKQVKHIVVVMMENRSFDHMLGYLSLRDTPKRMGEVRGLRGPDEDFNLDPRGDKRPIHAFDTQDTKVQRRGEPLDKRLDPDHSPKGVKKQIGTDMDGFVVEYVDSRKKRKAENFGPDLWDVPMGYYTGKDVPVYDHLARNYCVCDAWHASIPGDTWPNRCYSIAGRQGDSVWKQSDLLQELAKRSSLIAKLKSVPIYDLEAFTRLLEPHQWRWYSHDPAILRGVDPEYRKLEDLKLDNFTWFKRRRWAPTEILQGDILHIVAADSFLDDVANGELRQVSWIDPNFFDVNVLDPHSNDDHPPSDILAGQQFVLDVYDALRRSPEWKDTVLVITYDEHGGFYDHVRPPAATDDPRHETLGVRVPALIVGPRVTRGVYHEAPGDEVWEHTALIRSILRRFHPDPDAALAKMGGRVAERTAHIGLMLEDEARTDLPPEATDPKSTAKPEERLSEWRSEARDARLPSRETKTRRSRDESPSVAPDGAGQPVVTTEWQQDYLKFALAMREAGLKPNELSEKQKAKRPEEPGPPASPQPA